MVANVRQEQLKTDCWTYGFTAAYLKDMKKPRHSAILRLEKKVFVSGAAPQAVKVLSWEDSEPYCTASTNDKISEMRLGRGCDVHNIRTRFIKKLVKAAVNGKLVMEGAGSIPV